MDKVTKTVSTDHNLFEEKAEPKRYRAEVLPLTSLTPYRWATPAHRNVPAIMDLYIGPCLRFSARCVGVCTFPSQTGHSGSRDRMLGTRGDRVPGPFLKELGHGGSPHRKRGWIASLAPSNRRLLLRSFILADLNWTFVEVQFVTSWW